MATVSVYLTRLLGARLVLLQPYYLRTTLYYIDYSSSRLNFNPSGSCSKNCNR